MANWSRAVEIALPGETYSASEDGAQHSARLLSALEAKVAAVQALSQFARNERISQADAELDQLQLSSIQEAASAVNKHFSVLTSKDAFVQEAIKPTPRDSTLWMDPSLHELFCRFLEDVSEDSNSHGGTASYVEWVGVLNPEQRVINANLEVHSEALKALQQALSNMNAARHSIRDLEMHAGEEDLQNRKDLS